ncbi:hypothetical protein ACIA48_02920 [Mycobacterium sp. NPDC051804]|uniref:hypothetical protein n=1 Tax=Mycobacterium sp. NPDC051804 TaxID=3364295 RepID=UPI003789F731
MTDAARETDDPPVEVERVQHVLAMLRERLYGAISCLATLAILARYSDEDTNALARVLDIAVATGGLWAASLLSHFVAQMAVFGSPPRGRHWIQLLQASGQILVAAVPPVIVLVLAVVNVLDTDTAMWIGMWTLVGELGVIALLAMRRTRLPWWQQALSVAVLVGLGLLVVGIKIIAH